MKSQKGKYIINWVARQQIESVFFFVFFLVTVSRLYDFFSYRLCCGCCFYLVVNPNIGNLKLLFYFPQIKKEREKKKCHKIYFKIINYSHVLSFCNLLMKFPTYLCISRNGTNEVNKSDSLGVKQFPLIPPPIKKMLYFC